MTDEKNYYKFVGCESDIRHFYQLHIQPFQASNNLSFILIPNARRKYWQPLSQSQIVMDTKLFSSKKGEDEFVRLLRKYEVQEGLYIDSSGATIPGLAMALYITLNPLDELRAYFSFQKEVGDRLQKMLFGTSEGNNVSCKFMSIYKSCLHTAPIKAFRKFDVDSKEPDKINSLKELFKELNITPHLVIETKNGYHVVIRKSVV